MKHSFRSFLSGFLCAALIFAIASSALAITGRMTIEVDPINIQVNGQTFVPKDVNGKEVPVFAYEGTTYAPLRALAEAYGLAVGYDPQTNLATVRDPDKALPAAPSVTTLEPGKLHVSTNAAFPPYEMVDDDGAFVGIDMELAAAVAQKLGLELVVDDMSFDAALTAAYTGQVDMVIAGFTSTNERLQVMDFSDAYLTNTQVVIVKEGSSVTLDNLGDCMIGCKKGTTGYIYASDVIENGGYGEDHVTVYGTGTLAVEALKLGQVDAVIIDEGPAKAYVAANPGLKLLETEWEVEDYAIGMRKGNTQLRSAVNAALAELKADGTIQAIVDKYIVVD